MSFYILDRDTEEWDELDLEEAIDEIPITFDYRQVILNIMYATYQDSKGKNRAENLYRYLIRDNMSTLELVLNMLAEATTTELSKNVEPKSFNENKINGFFWQYD